MHAVCSVNGRGDVATEDECEQQVVVEHMGALHNQYVPLAWL